VSTGEPGKIGVGAGHRHADDVDADNIGELTLSMNCP
jgi:hypothetical protein